MPQSEVSKEDLAALAELELGNIKDTDDSGFDRMLKAFLDHLYNTNELKMLMSNDFSMADIPWVTEMYAIDYFVFQPTLDPTLVTDKNKMSVHLSEFRKRVLAMRLSINRKSRTEAFDVLKHVNEGGVMSRMNNFKESLFR